MFSLFNHKAKKKEGKKEPDEDWLPFEGNWLPWTKGTIAEPWTTPKEFMENKDFQKKMKEVRKVIDKVKTNSK